MLRLKSLEVEGFGPFADRQIIQFPQAGGVTVIYGENMRGKTSLLNAIRYAFFGVVLGRGSRKRTLHGICNRERATDGNFGFRVSLTFDYDEAEFQLVRECRPRVQLPANDGDYDQQRQLRRGASILGPQESEKLLQQIFPEEVSRFFLFDGELLQEYEELLIHESSTGSKISDAIERILGVPLLKRGKMHLTHLGEEADKAAAKEASKTQATQALGNALQQATEQKEEHQREVIRLQNDLKQLQHDKIDAEQFLQSVQKFSLLVEQMQEAEQALEKAATEQKLCQTDLQTAMAEGWRTLLRDPVRMAREKAQEAAKKDFSALSLALRRQAVESGHCNTCEQAVSETLAGQLRNTLPTVGGDVSTVSPALTQLADLNRFREANNAEQVHQIWDRLRTLDLEQITQRDKISDFKAALVDADPDTLRRSKVNYVEVLEKITVVRGALDEARRKVEERDSSIQTLKRKLSAHGTLDLAAVQSKAELLRQAAEVFGLAVEQYKDDLRTRVEKRSTELFVAMTTEKEDYAGLTINESYGLTIRHRDRRVEEARSAGAEHVVALALMGALQNNAPLRGPIVMDSPFGRLDEEHTSNVIATLPLMAEQVILLVYEAEVGKEQVRNLLEGNLAREYELVRVNARRTNIREVR